MAMLPPTRFMKPLLLSATHLFHFGTSRLTTKEEKPEGAPLYLWPGDAALGKRILSRQFPFAGCEVSFTQKIGWYSEEGSVRWLETLHGFSWMKDVLAFNRGALSAAALRDFIADWIEHSEHMHASAHWPEVTGERIANWIAFGRFYLKGSSFAFRRKYLKSLIAQIRLLEMAALTRPGVKGTSSKVGFAAIKGLIYASLALPLAQYLLKPTVGALYFLLETTLLADGAHIARSPSVQLDVLKLLVEIQYNLKHCQGIELARLDSAVSNVAGMLCYLSHGDGRLALFNNSTMESKADMQRVLSLVTVRMPDEKLPAPSGFHRLMRAETLAIMDAGAQAAYNPNSHSGTLSFELSDGQERLIVNCGAYRGNDFAWRKVPRSTAAHSTLTIDERNSWDAGDNLRDGAMPRVSAMRGERDGNVFVDAVYNGYARYCGLTHSRQLYLTADGDRLSGADILTSRDTGGSDKRHLVTIRFHLHPSVKANQLEDGAVMLGLASGKEWIFQSSHQLQALLEESVYLGNNGKPVRSQQIALSQQLGTEEMVVEWAFSKV